MAASFRCALARWTERVLVSTFLLLLPGNAQKKPFEPSSLVSPDLLHGPTSARHDQLKPVTLNKDLFGAVVAKEDVDTGQVRRLEGTISLPRADTEQESVAAFLKSNAKMLGASTDGGSLKLLREIKSATGDHFYYQQMYEGRPVWGGRVSVHNVVGSKAAQVINDLRKLSPPSDKSLSEKPDFNELNETKAIQVAEKAVNFKTLAPQKPTAEPGFLEVDGQAVAVWRVRYATSEPGAVWEVMVNAKELKPLSARNVAAYQSGPKASVFHDDPIESTGNQNLTLPMTAQDPNMAILQGARRAVILSELDGKGQLDGKFATTDLTTAFARAKSANLDFTYDWNDPHFRETMAYYWVTECAHYLASLGYGNIFLSRIAINVDGTTDDNSLYANGTLTFGSGGVPDAEDAEVIFHELGHAIQDAQVPGLLNDGGEEVRAISEGFGDYWAASYFAGFGPKGAAWDTFFDKWDGSTENPASGANPPFLRKLDSIKKYPKDLDQEVHDDGEIWSACLWKIRAILGKDLTAKIVLESNFRLTPTSKFPDAANAILLANQTLNGGTKSAAIRKVFEDRGILQPISATKVFPKNKN
jgi:Zn-dependent metalloprotease